MVSMERRKMSNVAKKIKHNYVAEILNSNKLNENINLLYYFRMMCPSWDNDTYFSLAKKVNNTMNRWSINRKELINLSVQNEDDFFCSVNTFYAPGKHSSLYVKNLNALIVDLDYYNIAHLKDLEPWQVIELMKQDLDYPEPSFYTSSGRGLCIVWLLEKTYATKKSKKFYKQIAETLIDVFENFGADNKVKDVTRVIRLDGTKNSKNGKTVKIITPNNFVELEEYADNPIRYELSDLAEYFWGIREVKFDKPKKPKKSIKRVCKITKLKNVYSLYCTRVKDLETLVELRKDKPLKGYREKLLFLYRLQLLFSGTDSDTSLKLTLNLNSKFFDPLDQKEVINATENAVGNAEVYHRLKDKYSDETNCSLNEYLGRAGVYIYKNSTIIKELEITLDEMEYMDTLINKEIKLKNKRVKNQEYYKTNKENLNEMKREKYKNKLKIDGKMSRSEKNNLIREKIKSLLAEGFTQKEIALQLDITTRTVRNHIKYIKENELL